MKSISVGISLLILVAACTFAQIVGPGAQPKAGFFPTANIGAQITYRGVSYDLPRYDANSMTFECYVYGRGTNGVDGPIMLMGESNTVYITRVSWTLDEFVDAKIAYTNMTDVLNHLVAAKIVEQLP